MEFGRVTTRELNKIDFSLPDDPESNKRFLKGKPSKSAQVFIGCAKWGRKEWLGKIYPKGTKESRFLDEYVNHYNAIELNATHYKPYSPADIRKWAEKARGKNFKFFPKVYQGISHFGNLTNKQPQTDSFLESIMAFEKHLGAVFLQMSDRFTPKRKDELFQYLATLPKDVQFFLEVRHPDWFTPANSEELFKTLTKLKIGAVITDTAGRRDCCHMHLTIPKTFIRYVGNSLHKTDYIRIDEWIDRMQYWLQKGVKEIYFFMHMHDEATSPELTVYLAEKLNKRCNLQIPVPEFISKQAMKNLKKP
jgi:uncharacterized protein YecE (DUF72 family)